MKAIGINDISNFNFIDKPKSEMITKAITILKIIGALDEKVYILFYLFISHLF